MDLSFSWADQERGGGGPGGGGGGGGGGSRPISIGILSIWTFGHPLEKLGHPWKKKYEPSSPAQPARFGTGTCINKITDSVHVCAH